MGPKEWGSISGQIIKQRFQDAYNANPNYCQHCGKKIEIANGSTASATKKKKFCDHSCAASYNNKLHPKRVAAKSSKCKLCGATILLKKSLSGVRHKRKICNLCLSENAFHKKTKGEFFRNASHWTVARAAITQDARRVFDKSRKKKVCMVCYYDKFVDICHVRPIADFPDSATIGEINSIKNLIPLCPNHHKEFDKGLISPVSSSE